MDNGNSYIEGNHILGVANWMELGSYPIHCDQNHPHKNWLYVYLVFLQRQISIDHLMIEKMVIGHVCLLTHLLQSNMACVSHVRPFYLTEIFLDCYSILDNHFPVAC